MIFAVHAVMLLSYKKNCLMRMREIAEWDDFWERHESLFDEDDICETCGRDRSTGFCLQCHVNQSASYIMKEERDEVPLDEESEAPRGRRFARFKRWVVKRLFRRRY